MIMVEQSGWFAALWIGQFLSVLATDVSQFALRTWTYQHTQSATQYAAVTFFSELPALAMSPVAGWLVDTQDRKTVLIGADVSSSPLPCLPTDCLVYLVWLVQDFY